MASTIQFVSRDYNVGVTNSYHGYNYLAWCSHIFCHILYLILELYYFGLLFCVTFRTLNNSATFSYCFSKYIYCLAYKMQQFVPTVLSLSPGNPNKIDSYIYCSSPKLKPVIEHAITLL